MAREIEEGLNLSFNTYARLIEHWGSTDADTTAGKSSIEEKRPDTYKRRQSFWDKHKNRHFIHVTIERSLELLTIVLGIAWLVFVIFYGLAYFSPSVLGL